MSLHPSLASSLAYHLSCISSHHHNHLAAPSGNGNNSSSTNQLPPELKTTTIDLNALVGSPSGASGDYKKSSKFYDIGNYSPDSLNQLKPWKTNASYFQNVYVSSVALMKMTIHADSGGDIEVMGMLTGKIIDNGMVIMDTYSLPVVGTETRVNAQSESYEYMVSYLDHLKKLGYRNENIVGWYHSHPGYGCWLSGIDVATESLNQTYQDPYLAIVVDPKMTKINGRVEIGAFRTYPEQNANLGSNSKLPVEDASNKQGAFASTTAATKPASKINAQIPDSKLKDFGAHSSRYYSLNVSVFKSEYDESVLKLLLNNYWISGLTTLIDDEDNIESNTGISAGAGAVGVSLLDKADEKHISSISSLLNQFNQLYTKATAKLRAGDLRDSLNLSSLSSPPGKALQKDTLPILRVLKLEKAKQVKKFGKTIGFKNNGAGGDALQNLQQGHEAAKNGKGQDEDEDIELEEEEESDYQEEDDDDEDYYDQMEEDGTFENADANSSESGLLEIPSKLKHGTTDDSNDVKMNDADEDDDDNEDNYGSIDSDTSIDNVSTFSSSSTVANSNVNGYDTTAKPISKSSSSNNYTTVHTPQSADSQKVSTPSSLVNMSGTPSQNIDELLIRKLQQKQQKRRDIRGYRSAKYKLQRGAHQQKSSTQRSTHLSQIPQVPHGHSDSDAVPSLAPSPSSSHDRNLKYKKVSASRPNYTMACTGIEKSVVDCASEDLRNSILLNVQEKLFF